MLRDWGCWLATVSLVINTRLEEDMTVNNMLSKQFLRYILNVKSSAQPRIYQLQHWLLVGVYFSAVKQFNGEISCQENWKWKWLFITNNTATKNNNFHKDFHFQRPVKTQKPDLKFPKLDWTLTRLSKQFWEIIKWQWEKNAGEKNTSLRNKRQFQNTNQ